MKTQLIRPRPTLSAEYIVTGIKRHKLATLAVLILIIMLAAGVSVYKYNSPTPATDDENSAVVIDDKTKEKDLKISRFITNGRVAQIAISPDGRYIAYVTAEGPEKNGLRLREPSTGRDVEILKAPESGQYRALSFSPNSDRILYVLDIANKNDIFQIFTQGGPSTKLVSGTTDGASLSPDGKTLAFAQDRDLLGEHLVLADPDGSNQRVLVAPSEGRSSIFCDDVPTWAPDGKSIACSFHEKTEGGLYWQVYSFSVPDGNMRRVTDQKWGDIRGAVYMPDGSLVIVATDFAEDKAGAPQLWRISISGEAKRITNDVAGYSGLRATRKGDALVTLQPRTTGDIWKLIGTDLSQARKVTSSGEFTRGFNWTPDGRILFGSTVSGNEDIWLMNADGGGRIHLTTNNGANTEPSMTKDGRYIIFLNRVDFYATHIFRMDADGKNLKQLTNEELAQLTPRLSPDGKWVYYVQNSRDGKYICKVSIDGGAPVILTKAPQVGPSYDVMIRDVSRKDGRIMFEYSAARFQVNAVRHFAIISPDSEPREVPAGLPRSAVKFEVPTTARGAVQWAPDGQHIVYREFKNGVGDSIQILDAQGRGKPRTFMPFPSELRGFRWSSDGKEMAYLKITRTSDAIVITNEGN